MCSCPIVELKLIGSASVKIGSRTRFQNADFLTLLIRILSFRLGASDTLTSKLF